MLIVKFVIHFLFLQPVIHVIFCTLKFRPVAVKQGTETKESSLASTGDVLSHSDEVHIEKLALNEKQRQLRQAFVTRFMLLFQSILLGPFYCCRLL